MPKKLPKPPKWLSSLQLLAEEEFRRGGDFITPPEDVRRTTAKADATKVHLTESKAKKKMHKVMREWKEGTLHSGSHKGPIVKKYKQAVAIGLSESGQSRPRRKEKE